jgi:hypothetical protein
MQFSPISRRFISLQKGVCWSNIEGGLDMQHEGKQVLVQDWRTRDRQQWKREERKNEIEAEGKEGRKNERSKQVNRQEGIELMKKEN